MLFPLLDRLFYYRSDHHIVLPYSLRRQRQFLISDGFVAVLQGLATSLPTQVPTQASPFSLAKPGYNPSLLNLGQTWAPGTAPPDPHSLGLGSNGGGYGLDGEMGLALIHIGRCRAIERCDARGSAYMYKQNKRHTM